MLFMTIKEMYEEYKKLEKELYAMINKEYDVQIWRLTKEKVQRTREELNEKIDGKIILLDESHGIVAYRCGKDIFIEEREIVNDVTTDLSKMW
jgi:serine phosphatase RsbU (regulator of sigma subunit)